jgi:hypothetical protein
MSFDFLPLTPEELFQQLYGLPFPFWICGGWAIEMFAGKKIREHHDIDVAILRVDHYKLKSALPDWEFKIAKEGVLHDWNDTELPRDLHTLWARKHGSDKWLTEFLVNESDDHNWIFRKNEKVTCLLSKMGLADEHGIPYLRPSIPLLFKSAHCRENDNLDFLAAHAAMDPREKNLLKTWITIFQPQCEWLKKL